MTANSAVVAARPSKISNSASPITALPIVNPAAVTVETKVAAPPAEPEPRTCARPRECAYNMSEGVLSLRLRPRPKQEECGTSSTCYSE